MAAVGACQRARVADCTHGFIGLMCLDLWQASVDADLGADEGRSAALTQAIKLTGSQRRGVSSPYTLCAQSKQRVPEDWLPAAAEYFNSGFVSCSR